MSGVLNRYDDRDESDEFDDERDERDSDDYDDDDNDHSHRDATKSSHHTYVYDPMRVVLVSEMFVIFFCSICQPSV